MGSLAYILHVGKLQDYFKGLIDIGAVVTQTTGILDCNIVPGFSCAVLSTGVLWRTQRIATIFNERPHLRFRDGSTIDIQTANDCYYFDVYDA